MPQNGVVVVDFPIHDTHCMGFEPCLFLECSKCGLTPIDRAELAKPCEEDMT